MLGYDILYGFYSVLVQLDFARSPQAGIQDQHAGSRNKIRGGDGLCRGTGCGQLCVHHHANFAATDLLSQFAVSRHAVLHCVGLELIGTLDHGGPCSIQEIALHIATEVLGHCASQHGKQFFVDGHQFTAFTATCGHDLFDLLRTRGQAIIALG